MTIDPERIARDIEAIAAYSETPPEVGYSRPTFSTPWRAAVEYVVGQARAMGCAIRVDAAGNVHVRPSSFSWETPLWLSGSHIDSVPTGGKFDGVVGVVAPLEVLRSNPAAPLELIIFAEEEGTTFNLGMLGSRLWAGTLSGEAVGGLRNKQGDSYLAAGAACGVSPAKLAADRVNPKHYRGLIELHVEQGLAMWNANTPVAVVTAINGRRQYSCTLTGSPNHAGSTRMADRQDALAGAAEIITALESWGRKADGPRDHTVITVGRLFVEPNAVNVIAGKVTFLIDFRARADETLERGDGEIRQIIAEIAQKRRLTAEVTQTEALPAMPLDAGVCEKLRSAAKKLGVSLPDTASGALHDAAILAPLLPTAMLFIASKGGISHNPAEFSRIEDIALATRILAEAVAA